MAPVAKRKTSLTLDVELLDQARGLGINVSSVADTALRQAVAQARQQRWREENAEAFAAQAEWHEKNGHPLADIIAAPGRASWDH
ncbi:type II toxin-antitoxin system CcdA family antitoxin [Antarcticimicrobium sp.]|uniref:type II toxin-antitoxin system CcdA family antitoxin n=1 Tax=Antarcticimicrobium sp. TaxID=2824147 RepID=UPI00262A8260|nr:type II toxin-antitoxin system CcdA family antitoxin [Antarcticimicrobium sp.]